MIRFETLAEIESQEALDISTYNQLRLNFNYVVGLLIESAKANNEDDIKLHKKALIEVFANQTQSTTKLLSTVRRLENGFNKKE